MSDRRTTLRWLGWGLIALGAVVMVIGVAQTWRPGQTPATAVALATPTPTATATITRTPTPEPIVPTPTPTSRQPARPSPSPTIDKPTVTAAAPTAAPTATTSPAQGASVPQTASPQRSPNTDVTPISTDTPAPASSTATPTVTPSPSSTPAVTPTPIPGVGGFRVSPDEHFRLGVSLPRWQGNPDVLRALKVGWVMDWASRSASPYGGGVAYAQTVRMGGGQLSRDVETLSAIAASNPGSLWLISNEPDVRWQDNVTADVYARLYHDAYAAIKAADASAVVAAGGIAQPSPLRLKYLDQALQHYQTTYGSPLPADAWHIHNYMLREERDSWGVDIPPGIEENTGVLYGIDDSKNLPAFRLQIVAFRQWMSSRGYGGQPLIVSEFGIPMPADYGFPPDVVAEFMRETTRYFLTATDAGLGDPRDGGRLVQRWCWFSIEYAPYPTGDLLDSEGNQWTTLGHSWLSMVGE